MVTSGKFSLSFFDWKICKFLHVFQSILEAKPRLFTKQLAFTTYTPTPTTKPPWDAKWGLGRLETGLPNCSTCTTNGEANSADITKRSSQEAVLEWCPSETTL